MLDQLLAVHSGHREVRNHEIVARRRSGQSGQRFLGTGAARDVVVERRRHFLDDETTHWIIVDDQNPFAVTSGHVARDRGWLNRRISGAREVNFKCGSDADRAADKYDALMRFDDSVYDGEAEARACTSRLGGKEWFVNVFKGGRVHSATVVGNRESGPQSHV